MNWAPPDWIREKSHKSMDEDIMSNHYAHPRGRPRLLKALSKHYSSQFENIVKEGRELAMDEIVVTAGANCGGHFSFFSSEVMLMLWCAGMFAAMVAHFEPGDEVILIEPFFDQYFAPIHFQGAKPVFTPPSERQGREEWVRLARRFRRVPSRVHPEDQMRHHQHAAQPGRQGVHPVRAGKVRGDLH